MKIRRFSGTSVPEVLRDVKAALGADAVILETAEVGGVVTVTAAADHDAAPAPAAASGIVRHDAELTHEVRELLGVVREHWRTLAPEPELLRLYQALAAQGVDGAIAAALVSETAERVCAGADLDAALAGALGRARAPAAPARVRLFVGPPGDGKTTTLAKLAAHERRAGRRLALITTDTYRVGAVAELTTYGRVLGAPVVAAEDARGLERALRAARDADLVLVDTAGAAPGQQAELAELAALADAAGDVARTLVVSAATGSWGAERAWDAFAALRPDGCVLTKLDVAPGGPMLGLLWRRGVPVSHLAAGRRIPDDLETATPDRLARCMLAA